jgi:hypothetical protein
MSERPKPIAAEPNEADGKRQRSAIGFPYADYNSVAVIAAAIHQNCGHGHCSAAQLAAWTDQSPKSSGFRIQLAAARLFGVLESDNPDSMRLTELGRQIADPAKARAAKAQAFLRVPLFKALYEKYKDGVTPPSGALEREIVSLGVAEKQKARARQVFESSAQQTGFRDAAKDGLVPPAVLVKDVLPVDEKPKGNGTGNDGGDGLSLDPLLMALLRKIPANDAGWPPENRLRWFRTFAMNVSQVYDDSEPVELEITLKGS